MADPISPKVRLLDPHTINQIAAGEVIERPASALKELVENALDAGATRIDIELRDAGRGLIRVSDNGCGMTPEDAQAALQRHATSKIARIEDLSRVASLGFRGEALPSIASVSRFTLSTATEDGMRFVLRVEGGRFEPAKAEAGPRGTEIRVEDLFYNTPARLKFLKSDTTELGACLDAVSKYAVGYPQIAFSLMHHGQEALRTTGSGDLLEAIAGVWSREIAKGLAEIDGGTPGMRVRGFVSPPHLTRPNRSYQYVFVNGRPVRTRTLTAALDQAFRDLTPDRRYPLLVLNLEVDPERVDVNVSPTKSEVKFQREGEAFEALRVAIKSALMEHGMMPSAEKILTVNEAIAPWPRRESPRLHASDRPSGPGEGTLSVEAQRPLESLTVPLPASQIETEAEPVRNERQPFASLLDGLRVLGQAMNTFIVAETRQGIVLIDQHVAHERILYEYLCGLKGPAAIETQALLVPQTLELDKRAALLVRERLDELQAVGYTLEPFGGESYLIRAVPAAIREKDPVRILRETVDELIELSVQRRLVPTREQIWITSSCKMAVKSGDPLSHAEMERLIVDLATTENPYLCPHGRPITVTLSKDELFRKFKRT